MQNIVLLFVASLSVVHSSLDYGLVMDVGSSHTQLFVYAWSHRETSSSSAPESKPTQIGESGNIKPGIQDANTSSYESVVNYLHPLIQDGKNITYKESSRWDTFPIYFKATAGMRMLNDNRRTELMTWVRKALSNSSFNPFYFAQDQAIILSGEEEAMFGWLTVNYLNDKLFDDDTNSNSDSDNDSSSNGNGDSDYSLSNTLGSLDLGGASTQITFAALPSSDILQSFTNVHLWDTNYRLYTHSFLEYGADAMQDRIAQLSYYNTLTNNNITNINQELEYITNYQNGDILFSKKILNPCLNDGYNKSYNISLMYDKTSYYQLLQYGNSKSMKPNKCRNYISSLFYNTTVCLTGDNSCSINGVYQKSILFKNMTFYAFSGFAYTIIDFNLKSNISLNEIYNYTLEICNMTYLELNSSKWGMAMRDNHAQDYVYSRCFMMTYVFSLLHDGYNFPLIGSNIIFVSETPNGTSYGWTQGSILRDANWLSYTLKTNDSEMTTEGKVFEYIAITTSVLFVLTLMTFIYCIAKMKKTRPVGYGHMDS